MKHRQREAGREEGWRGGEVYVHEGGVEQVNLHAKFICEMLNVGGQHCRRESVLVCQEM